MDNNINIDMKEVYEATIRNSNNIDTISDWTGKIVDAVNDNFDLSFKYINDINKYVRKNHKAQAFLGLALTIDVLMLFADSIGKDKKIKALEQRVEALERRGNLHVCSGDCTRE